MPPVIELKDLVSQIQRIKFHVQQLEDQLKEKKLDRSSVTPNLTALNATPNNLAAHGLHSMLDEGFLNLSDVLEGSTMDNPDPPDSDQIQRNRMPHTELPGIELEKFTGDPLEYLKFMRTFTTHIGRKVRDNYTKLLYLIQHCDGEAKEAIQHCAILKPQEGYYEAIRILQERFGQTDVIILAILDQLTNGPPLKNCDSESLHKLINQMRLCDTVLKEMNCAADLNTHVVIQMITRRLPLYLRLKWAESIADAKRGEQKTLFQSLLSFLVQISKIISFNAELSYQNGPPFLISSLSPFESNAPKLLTKTSSKANLDNCSICNESHSVDQCPQFLKETVPERIKLVRKHQLCELCLTTHHAINNCISETVCSIKGCGKQHHELVHWMSDLQRGRASMEETKVTVMSPSKLEEQEKKQETKIDPKSCDVSTTAQNERKINSTDATLLYTKQVQLPHTDVDSNESTISYSNTNFSVGYISLVTTIVSLLLISDILHKGDISTTRILKTLLEGILWFTLFRMTTPHSARECKIHLGSWMRFLFSDSAMIRFFLRSDLRTVPNRLTSTVPARCTD